MNERFKKRLETLKAEYTSGEKMLAELQARESELRQSMLRISGAIQVLEEELAAEEKPMDSNADTIEPNLNPEMVEMNESSQA